MKLIVSSLSLALLLTGCSQPKNRLADEKNLDYQKRMAAKNPQTKPSELVVLDVKPPVAPQGQAAENNSGATASNPQQQPIVQLPPTVEPADEPKGKVEAGHKPAEPQSQSTTPVAKPDQKPAPAAPQAPVASASEDKSVLTEAEEKAFYQSLAANGVNTEETFAELFTVKMGDIKQPSIAVEVKDDVLSAQISDGEKVVTQIENLKMDKSGKAVKVDSSNGFKVNLICANECQVIFFGVSKIENNVKTVNLPAVLKLVDGQYVMAKPAKESSSASAPAASAPAAAAPIAPAASSTAPAKSSDEVFIELDELQALYQTFKANGLGSKDDVTALFSVVFSDNAENLRFKVEGTADEFSLQATVGPKIISEAKKIKLDKTNKISVTESSNGFNLITMCAKECGIVYASFLKATADKLEASLPILLKNVGGEYKSANMRPPEHYQKEAEKLKAAAEQKK